MELNRTPNPLDRNARNGENENWDIIEGEVRAIGDRVDNFVDEVSDAAFDKVVDNAKINWKEPVDNFNSLPTNAQKGDTRMDKSTGKVYRYDGSKWVEIQQIDAGPVNELDSRLSSQLAQTDDKSFYNGLVLNRDTKPMMVLIDDDGNPAIMNMLKPVIEDEKVPLTLAVITDRVKNNNSASLSLQQLKDLQKIGFDITSHTATHRPLSSLSNEEQHEEIRSAKEWLKENGFNHDFIVYPFGSADENTQSIAKQYVRGGVYIDYGQSRVNKPPLNQYRMERVYYNLESGENRVQLVKNKIDEAINDSGLLIVGMHCHYNNFDPQGLKECIQYAKQRGIPIVTLSEAINFYGNIIDLPDLKVDANGDITSTKFGKYQVAPGSFGINGNTEMKEFEEGETISSHTGGNSYEGMPVASSSLMKTIKPASNYLTHQEVYVLSNGNIYRRYFNNAEQKWNDWRKVYPQEFEVFYTEKESSINLNGVTPLTEFDIGITRTLHSSSATYEGMPINSMSVMYTHRPKADVYSYQEVYVFSNKDTYKRNWDNTEKKWMDWEKEPSFLRRDREFDFGTVPSGSCVVRKTNSPAVYNMNKKTINATPIKGDIPSGCIPSFSINDGVASFSVCNITGQDILVGKVTFSEIETRF